MEHMAFSKNARRRPAGGFSLVELLTVIGIIVLLVGILIPAVNKVRQSAKNTSTKATITTLATGLETFRADQQVGGRYAPSASDSVGSSLGRIAPYEVSNVYAGGVYGAGKRYIEISGAGLLVWALAGADMLGTPGFKTFRPSSGYWCEDTDTAGDPSEHGAYALDDDTRQPLAPRVGPLVDLSKVSLTRWNPQPNLPDSPPSFEIPAEVEAEQDLGKEPAERAQRLYPMFLDAFGGPILYYRADPAGLRIADESPPSSMNSLLPENRGIYHFRDNSALLDDDAPNAVPLKLTPSNKPHRLYWDDTDLYDPQAQQQGFAGYIRNKAVNAKVVPFNPSSFLLMSAGADGVFGTGDDVANFEHNGAELQDRR